MSKLSEQQQRDVLAVAGQKDENIDFSDIPEIKTMPPNAVIGQFYRPKKTSLTLRLDVDIVAWLKASGEGYQTRVNTCLRQLMSQQRKTD